MSIRPQILGGMGRRPNRCWCQKTVLLRHSVDRMILFIRLGTIPACDRQTDGFAVANKALCITSNAAALEKSIE